MSGPLITVTVDIGDVEKGLDAMERRGHALEPVMQSLKKPLRDDQLNHKREQSGPSGAWAPRASSTLLRAHGKRKLSRSVLGKLPAATSYAATASSVSGTSKVRWSGAHQDGDRVGHGARLPSREYLYISEEMLELGTGAVADAMASAYGGHA